MLKHCVFVAADTSDALARTAEAMALIEGMLQKIPGMLDLSHGPNLDFEGKSQAYPYGFIITFADRAAHLAYDGHPDHQKAGGLLVAAATGGAKGILVTDLEV
ncbi:Dabb family protein [Rhodophyticola sp. CCM32]|uniref:Dabb family protein n=1 Tax=Rhodophyticola sp. CCM32 TaxID=2916397 RepID=UPI00107FB6A7|nr:Dabb family protein [Rhodophyticola sp. CCM32]QBY00008.1 Dabb family protein [Rhodophyticola sp. CCM32]